MVENEELSKIIQKCPPKVFEDISHLITTRLCSNKSVSFEKVSEYWSLEDWWRVSSFLEDILVDAVKRKSNQDLYISSSLSNLSEEYRQIIVDVLNVRKDDIYNHLMIKTSDISHNVLTDFDWQMKLVMSSDKLSAINEPLLNLDLETKDTNDSKQITSLELTKADLQKLISSLDGASKAVQQLTM